MPAYVFRRPSSYHRRRRRRPLRLPASSTGVSLAGPTLVDNGSPAVYTVALSPVGSTPPGPVTVTPATTGVGGTLSPATVTLTAGSPSATFTRTPAAVATETISVTNDAGLSNGSPISLVVQAAGRLVQFSDLFARADGVTTGTGKDWRGPTGSTLSVASTRMVPTSGFPLIGIVNQDFNRKALGPSQYVRDTLLRRPANNQSIGLRFKVHNNQSYSLFGYNDVRVQLDALAAGDTIRVFRTLDGVATQLGSTYSIPGGVWADDSPLEMRAVDSALTVLVNGSVVLTTTDTVFANMAGQAGVYATAASGSWGHFDCGVPAGVKNLVWGPKIGGPSTSGAIKVRARSSHAATLSLQYGTDPTFSATTTTAGVIVDSGTDYTAGFTLTGLLSATVYYCRVLIDGTPKGYTPYGTFRTAPTPGTAGVYRFLLGSCERQTFHDGICAAMAGKAADGMLFFGDQYYADTIFSVPATTLAHYRGMIRDQYTPGIYTANWAALQSQFASWEMWDDHNIVDDYAGDGTDAQFVAAKAAWLEGPGGTTPDPVQAGKLYYSVVYGDVGFFVLDMRSHRGGGSILGATQLADLKAFLLANNQTCKIKPIIAPVPSHAFPMTGTDAWGGATYLAERDALYDWIAANNIRGVVWIAGDQHQGSYIKEVRNGVNYHTFQTTGTVAQTIPQTSTNAAIKWVFPVANYYGDTNAANFGMLVIDSTARPRAVTFTIYNRAGNAVADATVPSTGGTTAGVAALTEPDLNAGLSVPGDWPAHLWACNLSGGIPALSGG